MRGRPLPADLRTLLGPHLPARDLEAARLLDGLPRWTRFAPIRVRAITLGRRIYLDPRVAPEPALMAHELCHVRQWREHGAVRFLARYVGAYLRNRLRGMGRSEAYRRIPLEEEAVHLAERVGQG